ncbi:L-tyrosine 3-hydroxylase [Streptomyces sp. NPDC018026]|uniref:L-tyrosine 3-hydroxylase n=1 Tax=Streptomyces sp. NPDC018026 TaxID=3365031 RepID=UPI0037A9B5C8
MTAQENTGRLAPADQDQDQDQDWDWDYGGYRYGLEPLFLPSPADAARARPGQLPLVRSVGERGTGPPPSEYRAGHSAPAPDLDVMDDVFWFRWITGHQVTFLLWHFMARALRSGPAMREEPDETVVTALTCLVEGCNTMLLYTGSCSPEAYGRFIRPAMYRQHHGFSGAWAPDYAPVRRLFGVRPPQWVAAAEAKQFRSALRANHAVHGAVAARLASGSESLLQRFAPGMRAQERSVYGALFDGFFLTTRRHVSDEELSDQLARRLRAVLFDVDRNRLHPVRVAAVPAESSVAVRECEQRFHSIVARLMPLPTVAV